MTRKKIHSFWLLFCQNQETLLHLKKLSPKEMGKQFSVLTKKLHQYNKDLDITIINGSTKSEIVITAHGNPYLFKEVELLVHYAPRLTHWKITALIQPIDDVSIYEDATDKPIEFYGISLKISDMYFMPLENKEQNSNLGIRVYFYKYKEYKKTKNFQEVIYILIEYLIGEKAFANDLTYIDFAKVPQKKDKLINLYYLTDYINDFNKEINK
jgi:hypothetical protein